MPGTGNVIATDDIGGVHHQLVKVEFGVADSATPVSSANPLPVTVANASLAVTGTFFQATQPVSLTWAGLTDTQLRASAVPVSLATLPSLATGTNAIGSVSTVDNTASGTLAAAAQTVSLSMAGGLSGAAVQITGTWVGTISFEGTVDGTNWVSINGVIAGTYAPGPSIAINGVIRLTPAGLLSVRVNATAWTSGTATISMRASAGTGGVIANQILPTVAIQNGVVSTVNSTTANLAAAAVFTGTSEEVLEYSTVMVSVMASHVSATDGLSVQFSSDGTNWDLADAFTIPAANGKTFSFGVLARYFRLAYTNGATLTTTLRIQTLFSRMAKKFSSQRPSDARTNENDFEETISYLKTFNGTSWDRARGMSLATTTGDTGAKTASGNGATQTNVGNKAVQVVIVLGTVSGVAPTCVFKLQSSVDGGTTWVDVPGAATATLTATGNFGISVHPGQAVTAGSTTSNTTATASGVIARSWRVVWTLGGTAPSFTITSITYNYLPN